MHIEKIRLTEALQKWVMEGFVKHAIESVGCDGGIIPFTFAAYEGESVIGVIDCKFFWGQLHIRYMFVDPSHRKDGIGKALLFKACSYAQRQGCHFAFVETMNFQAVEFYKKMGFVEEFSRPGYANGTSFHYLKKDFVS